MADSLQLPGVIHVEATDLLFDDLAAELMSAALSAVSERGEFHLALSGGSTPEPFYQRLVIDPRWRAIPWEQTHLWMVDERCVPADDDRYNYKMIREVLADHVSLRNRRCHPMPVLQRDSAKLYEADIRRCVDLNSPTPRLDFILLGVGDDAHTASLFPHSDALCVADKLIAVNAGPNVTPPDRLTMTYPLLNAARRTAVLVTGAKKTATLGRIKEANRSPQPDVAAFPILGVRPTHWCEDASALTWFLDFDAAG